MRLNLIEPMFDLKPAFICKDRKTFYVFPQPHIISNTIGPWPAGVIAGDLVAVAHHPATTIYSVVPAGAVFAGFERPGSEVGIAGESRAFAAGSESGGCDYEFGSGHDAVGAG